MVCCEKDLELHKLAKAGDDAGIKQAILAGANTSVKNEEGKTPAEVASNAATATLLNSPCIGDEQPSPFGGESFVTMLQNQPKRTGFPLPPLPFSKTTQSA